MEKKNLGKLDIIILIFLLLIAFVFRLYHITSPLSDSYSWRQADTAAVARNFVKDGFNLLEPRYDDLSSIQSGKENPEGLRFVEFPLYNAMFGLLYAAFPYLALEVYGRLISIVFSLILICIIYILLFTEHSRTAAIIGAFIYGVFPAFVFFSRVVLPETTAVSFTFLSILLLSLWQKQKKIHILRTLFFFSLMFFSIGILIKPTVIFFGFALLYIFVEKYRWSVVKKALPYLYFILSLLPFVLWRLYIQKSPEAIPSSEWLISSVNTFEGQKQIFMKPAFFRWILFERINIMIFGGFLTGFFILGLFVKLKKLLLHSIIFSSIAYLFVFQGGNVQHEYYQTVILPAFAIFSAIGTSFFIQNRKMFISPFLVYPIIIVLFIFSFMFSYYYKVKDFYTYPKDLNHMAKILKTFTKSSDKVITDRLGDTTLLYLADRKGAPMLYKTLEEFKEEGYAVYMTDKKEIIADLKEKKQYHILFENEQFVLFKL
ncbi:MAG: glycosyltransferase family 39 protein [Patescibacteria group bacterium]